MPTVEADEDYWDAQEQFLRKRLEEVVREAKEPLRTAVLEVIRKWDPDGKTGKIAGRRTGIGQGALSEYSNGNRVPGGENLLLIHLITGWSLDRILGVSAKPTPHEVVAAVAKMSPEELGPLLDYLRKTRVIAGQETLVEAIARTTPSTLPDRASSSEPIALPGHPNGAVPRVTPETQDVAPPGTTNPKRKGRRART